MRKLDKLDLNLRHIGRSGNDVVRELTILHRSLFQNDIFVERQADALGNAAFDLARRQQWVDHPATLHNRDEVGGPSCAVDEIEFDFRHITAPAVGGVSFASVCLVVPMDFGRRFVSNKDLEFPVLRQVLSGSGSEDVRLQEALPQFQRSPLDKFPGDHRRA